MGSDDVDGMRRTADGPKQRELIMQLKANKDPTAARLETRTLLASSAWGMQNLHHGVGVGLRQSAPERLTLPLTVRHHLQKRGSAQRWAAIYSHGGGLLILTERSWPEVTCPNPVDSGTAAHRAGFGAKPNPVLLSATVWSIEAVFGLEGPVCLGDYVIS